MAIPAHRPGGRTSDPAVPAALMPAPELAATLRARRVRVPVSLVLEASHAVAAELPRCEGRPVVVVTQDYGMGYKSAAGMLEQLLESQGCPLLRRAPAVGDAGWVAAVRSADTRGALVLAAAPHELGEGSAAVKHASLVIEIVPDPPTWPPQAWPDDASQVRGAIGWAAEWVRHPLATTERKRFLARVVARIKEILAAA